MQLTLELLQHFSHARDATHCLQLHSDGLGFQVCDIFTSEKSTKPAVFIRVIHQPPHPLPNHSLIQEVNIPAQGSSHTLKMKRNTSRCELDL